jgi:AcrR family transcriptional regulator
MPQPSLVDPGTSPIDRRTRRHRETVEEILDLSVQVMTRDGVNGLALAEVARLLGVKPPSLYKYFPSLMAVYDALFLRGAVAHLEAMRSAMETGKPGLPALTAGLERTGRWCLANRALAELLFWRPVPSFEPSKEAFHPSIEMVELQRAALRTAADLGQLGPDARDPDAVFVVSVIIAGVLTQALANEPDVPWGEGRFSSQFPALMRMLTAAFPLDAG